MAIACVRNCYVGREATRAGDLPYDERDTVGLQLHLLKGLPDNIPGLDNIFWLESHTHARARKSSLIRKFVQLKAIQ